MSFPLFRQFDKMDCGPTCLRMIAKYYGKHYTIDKLKDLSFVTKGGSTLLNISDAAEKIGFRTFGVKVSFEDIKEKVTLPCILHWNNQHFVVLPRQKFRKNKKNILIADPAKGMMNITINTFLANWKVNQNKGIALILEPTDSFYENEDENIDFDGMKYLLGYIKRYKKHILQLFLTVFLASILSLITPFLTQSLVDNGINHQNQGYVILILISQLIIFFGNTSIDLIRGWILLHLNSRININILTDFLAKLMKLPIGFFDSKMIGDIHQRIGDHSRIQSFLTGATINTLFSLINLMVFSIVLAVYNAYIFLIFWVFSTTAIFWIVTHLKRRKTLDYQKFKKLSDNENVLFELITGMQEIKLNNCETSKRWEWERVQAYLYKINNSSLKLGQIQQSGSAFLHQCKNILITYVAARAVMDGRMTIGVMISVSFIIGQMNGPLEQLLGFIQSFQDAKLSLDRLGEIHNKQNEEQLSESSTIPDLDRNADILLHNVSFNYGGPNSSDVLSDVSFTIPAGKVTAIVGASGSGKTTLLKLLLKFYNPSVGKITIGNIPLIKVSAKWWRSVSGSVMQDGHIFSGTIAKNISISEENVSISKLRQAAEISNVTDFVEELPNGYQTKIGNTGILLSAGQRQRIQIARAVYKNPNYLFFDEATSALDSRNERFINENLQKFYKGRTVLVIAHRLSTVKNADQIIVLEKGKVVEIGTHADLMQSQSYYYNLIQNQLEMQP